MTPTQALTLAREALHLFWKKGQQGGLLPADCLSIVDVHSIQQAIRAIDAALSAAPAALEKTPNESLVAWVHVYRDGGSTAFFKPEHRAEMLRALDAAPAGEPVAWRVQLDGLWLHARDRDGLIAAIGVKLGRSISPDQAEPLYAAPAPAEPAPVPAEWLKAVQEAYGWLWNINDEPLAPIPMLDEGKAAYQARKALRDLLTSDQRGEAINAVRGTIENMLAAAPASPKG